jgi:peptidoglycan L-alanyl-D-glutamate endopeptidase CwlK
MSNYVLGDRSKNNLKGVNKELQEVVERAIEISKQDFTVIEGMRTMSRQRQLKAQGFSKTLNSRHLTGHAVDIVPYPIPSDWSKYTDKQWDDISKAMLKAAKEKGIDLEWGFAKWGWDKPHYQLSHRRYPK